MGISMSNVQSNGHLMIIYKRYIDKKLLSLRISFFILGVICFLAFNYQNEKLGYFISVVLITLSLIGIKDFVVYSDSFQISNYYFFGLILRTWRFNKGDNLKISTFGQDFGLDGDVPFIDDAAYGVGCLFSVFSIFVPPKITKKYFKIEKFNESNKLSKRVRVLLDRPEFNYLQTFINQTQDI